MSAIKPTPPPSPGLSEDAAALHGVSIASSAIAERLRAVEQRVRAFVPGVVYTPVMVRFDVCRRCRGAVVAGLTRYHAGVCVPALPPNPYPWRQAVADPS